MAITDRQRHFSASNRGEDCQKGKRNYFCGEFSNLAGNGFFEMIIFVKQLNATTMILFCLLSVFSFFGVFFYAVVKLHEEAEFGINVGSKKQMVSTH